jgi:O-antigen/teichoic acid export membrane protein
MMHTLTRIFKRIHIGDFGKVLIRFASSQVIANFMRLIAGFLVVSMMDPEQYGIFTGVGIYLGYFALGHVGVINGLGREFPYQMGRGNDEYGRRLASSAFTITFLIGSISALFFFIYAIIQFLAGNNLMGFTLLSYVVISGFNLFNTQFLPTLYRTNADFDKLARLNLIFGVVNLVTVILVYFFSFQGLLARGLLLALTQFSLLYGYKSYPLFFRIIKEDVIHLFKTGLPIYMVGQVNSLWATVLNNIIFSFGGARYFGLYALANIVQSSMAVVPQSFGQVIYPRMSNMYGRGDAPNLIIRRNLKPLVFQLFVMLSIAIFGVIVLPIFIPVLLPQYVEGIGPAQWIIFASVATSFGAINNIFNVTKRQKYWFVALITGAVVGTIYIYIRLKGAEFDLSVFPQGYIIGIVIQQAIGIFFAFRLK